MTSLALESPLRTVRVGLAGCGVVGRALVRLLHESADSIAARHGVRFELSRVLVRDLTTDRGVPITSDIFTDDRELFSREDVDVVVEAIGGEEAAGEIARTALGRGQRFVTANKQLIASAVPELSAIADSTSTSLDFGASVGGSAPVIALLRDLLGTATPASVRGILNGTSNYVLTRVERGESLDCALDAARSKGLAEADCARDLDGSDAAAKLGIICWLSFGIAPSDLTIERIPLTPTVSQLSAQASRIGGRVRVISQVVALPGHEIVAAVEPVVVPFQSQFARTEFEDNRVEVDLGWSAPVTVSGPGAGGAPTATALLSDLLHSSFPTQRRRFSDRAFRVVDDPREHDWIVVTESGTEFICCTRTTLCAKTESCRERGVEYAVARLEVNAQ